MKSSFKISGKIFPAPHSKHSHLKWKLLSRPGGWFIAESINPIRRARIIATQVKGKLSVSLHGKLFYGEWTESAHSVGQATSASKADLVAQFPGKVRKILVMQDQRVKEGEPLILVEAMKMEFAIKAPYSGTVSKILVKEGQQLSPGDLMIDVEAQSG